MTRMEHRGDYMKINFAYIQIHKWILQTVKAEILDEKMESFV